MSWVCVCVCRPWPIRIACIFCNQFFLSFHFVFINFNSKVRSSFQLGCAAFNLICVACAIVLCCAVVCSVVHRVSVHLMCSGWREKSKLAYCLAGWPRRTLNYITGLHAHKPITQIACAFIFSVFICKRINLLHICGNQRVREARR